ncbi:hypothetical protein F5B19DRAFT_502307 [Rostrohypoxylon terebratum]|nr:hypothetical protein F5B19DRAFT_502307 [Rostrohypoxylon terebratum]
MSSMAFQSQNDIALAIRTSASQNAQEPDDKMDIDSEHASPSSSSSTACTSDKAPSSEETLVEQLERTPSPSIDPEDYATWGREHFGEEWYRRRNEMLSERNIFLSPDPVYKQRQSALRMLERDVEGRTFMLPHGMDGKPSPPVSPPSTPTTVVGTAYAHDYSSLFGSAPPSSQPVPSSSQPVPSSSQQPVPSSQPDMSDPWGRLEYYRRRHKWDDLEYHIEIVLLEEALIDQARSQREDKLGNQRLEDELEAMHDLQKTSPGYRRQRRCFEMRTLGWSDENEKEEEDPPPSRESDSDSIFGYGEDSSDEDVIS